MYRFNAPPRPKKKTQHYRIAAGAVLCECVKCQTIPRCAVGPLIPPHTRSEQCPSTHTHTHKTIEDDTLHSIVCDGLFSVV